MHLVVKFQGNAFETFAKRMDQLASGARFGILAQALNEGGSMLRKATVAAETAQTGLKQDVLERAQVESPASGSYLTYTISATGGNVRLKYFDAKESGSGVTAKPWNKQTFYQGAFIKSGWQTRRVVLGGHVYKRVGSSRLPIKQERSGLFIPTEMTKGQTAATFESKSKLVLDTVVSRLGALMP